MAFARRLAILPGGLGTDAGDLNTLDTMLTNTRNRGSRVKYWQEAAATGCPSGHPVRTL